MTRVLIAGGGVAAIEAMLALHALAEDRVEIELLGPEPHFWYRPLSVAEPFGVPKATRHEVGALVAAAGCGTFTLGALRGIDAGRHEATTSVGGIGYDIALVAVGAVPSIVVPGALTFRGPADDEKICSLLLALEAGTTRRVAFAVPPGVSWPLPLYELALMTGSHLRSKRINGAELVLVTPEAEPLQVFGRPAGDAVRQLLEERGIRLHTQSSPVGFVDGELRLADARRMRADCVVTLPQLRGAPIDGLPATTHGFIPVDRHGRVAGREDVYAAGDTVDFPVKQGGIAAQLADAAAEAIAAKAGADVEPRPFRPVLRALLLTGAQPLYLRRELNGARQVATAQGAPEVLPAKIGARLLAPFLESLGGIAARR